MNPLLKSLCKDHDIHLLGVVPPKEDPSFDHFLTWLTLGKHGEMSYLERYLQLRQNPSLLEQEATSVIVCAYPYGEKTSWQKSASSRPKVAQYGKLKDYHKFLHQTGRKIIDDYLAQTGQSQAFYRVVVDSAPILEKSLAEQTGAGFIGKNTLFILPGHGSLMFLFEIFTSARIDQSSTMKKTRTHKGCGSCRRCQVHCPTGALDEDYVLDATKCLAYYTIEHRSLIPIEYWDHLAEYYFGCDICQLVCPHNRFARKSHLLQQHVPDDLPLDEIALMNQQTYEQLFGGTPMTRAKIVGLRRNAFIAMYVTNHPRLSAVSASILAENQELLVRTLQQGKAYEQRKQSGE
ncbi:MAG: tRNA epoxyqueuosine(34) reductase QueG [Proteobacteria bacterium]|nr:tRNA epoxyqueuosine(34) reductase QueG [Pseudomonadota bacterium]